MKRTKRIRNCFAFLAILQINEAHSNGTAFAPADLLSLNALPSFLNKLSSVQSHSRVQLFATPWSQHARPPCPSPTPGLSQTHVHQVSDAIQPSHPLSSPSPPAANPSQHQGLSNESTLRMRWPKYWSFSFSINPSNEHPGLISFRMDWLDLLAVQGTLKSLLQHHNSKASILWHSAFFTVLLSHHCRWWLQPWN